MTEFRPCISVAEEADALRFSVDVDGRPVSACLPIASWEERFGPGASDATMLELYRVNQPLIDEAVARCVQGRRGHKVVLRARDL